MRAYAPCTRGAPHRNSRRSVCDSLLGRAHLTQRLAQRAKGLASDAPERAFGGRRSLCRTGTRWAVAREFAAVLAWCKSAGAGWNADARRALPAQAMIPNLGLGLCAVGDLEHLFPHCADGLFGHLDVAAASTKGARHRWGDSPWPRLSHAKPRHSWAATSTASPRAGKKPEHQARAWGKC